MTTSVESDIDMTEELLGVGAAAEVLNELMPDKTPRQWITWLTNNRNQSRTVSYRIPTVRIWGGVFYRRAELEGFVELEKSRQLGTIKLTGRVAEALRAFGINEPGGGPYGRELKTFRVGEAVVDGDSRPFAQLTVGDPLSVYRIEIEQIKTMIAELTEVRDRLKARLPGAK